MKHLQEYIIESSNNLDDIISKIDNKETVIANNTNIKDIIRYAIKKLGKNADLNFIDVSKVTDMDSLFKDLEFNGDISKWDVSNVKDMVYMFDGSNFNQDISKWDVSNVTNMNYMFANSNFNQDISKWDVKNLRFMLYMFDGSNFNQDISKWNVSKVEYMDCIFYNCNLKEEYRPKFKKYDEKETEQQTIKKTKPTLSELKEYIDEWVSDTIDGWSTSWEDNKSKRKDLSNADDWFMNEFYNWLDDNGYIVAKKYIEELQQYMLKQVKEEIKYYKN